MITEIQANLKQVVSLLPVLHTAASKTRNHAERGGRSHTIHAPPASQQERIQYRLNTHPDGQAPRPAS